MLPILARASEMFTVPCSIIHQRLRLSLSLSTSSSSLSGSSLTLVSTPIATFGFAHSWKRVHLLSLATKPLKSNWFGRLRELAIKYQSISSTTLGLQSSRLTSGVPQQSYLLSAKISLLDGFYRPPDLSNHIFCILLTT